MKTLAIFCLTLFCLHAPRLGAVTVGTGLGLCADYYNDSNFGFWVSGASDTGTLDHDWAGNSPIAAVDPDYFSVIWQGSIEAQYSETYTLYFRNDDGGRVYLNNILILDNMLPPHGVQETSTAVAMSAGLKIPIRVEMYENAGLAVAQLSWSSLSTPKQIVPASQLYCTYAGIPTPSASPTPWAPLCLNADSFEAGALKPFWKDRQIGLGLSGTAVAANSLSFSASGITTSNKSDGFRYIYQESGGDFDVSLKVDFVGDLNISSRAGLMARESLDSQARYAAIYAAHEGLFRFQTRTATGANAGNVSAGAFVNNGLSPAWLRLKRQGDFFGSYYSSDGSSWSQCGVTETVMMPPNLLIGIAALSASGGQLRFVKVEDFRPYGCGLTPVALEIYDSAGNRVAALHAGFSATPLNNLSFSANPWDPAQGALRLSSGSWFFNFDGKDSGGNYLANGVYYLKLEAEGSKRVEGYITVIRSEATKLRAWAAPNPAGKGSARVEMGWDKPSLDLEADVFNLAGEKVLHLGALRGGRGGFSLAALANGIYFVSLKIPGDRRPTWLKVAVAR